MVFTVIKEEEYVNFWERNLLKNFLSSIETGKYRKSIGWDVEFFGVKENNVLIGAAMIVSKKNRLGFKEFYSPRGFLIDYNNRELVEFFTKNLKEYIKKKKGYVLVIDPYLLLKERDINGNYVENGFDNTKVCNYLKELGYINYNKDDNTQVSWMFSLNLEGKTKDEIFKEFDVNGKNCIRYANKYYINVRELSYEELDLFFRIVNSSGIRKGFKTHSLEYYQKMYKLYKEKKEIKFLITEINLKETLEKLTKELTEKEKELKEISKKSRINVLNEEITNLKKKIDEVERISNDEDNEKLELSAGMFILTKPEVVYLISGNYEKYLNFKSQYLIQWEMIQYAIENGYKKYNFYGIPKNIHKKKDDKDYGIYAFKKNFNGQVEELIGEWELPIGFRYRIMRFLKKIIN